VERNRWIQRSSAVQLKRWLLRSFRENDFEPLQLLPSRDADGQIRALFDTWHVDDQEKFKLALTLAVSEWRYGAHGANVLTELLHLAALIRASTIVNPVAVLFRRVFDNVEQTEEFLDLMDTAVAVVAGFAGVPAADALMEQWFFDTSFPPELLGTLLVGLCLPRAAEYPQFLPRFLQHARNRPDLFDLDYVLDAFVDTVTPAVFARQLNALETPALVNLNAVLAEISNPPVRLMLQSSGCQIIDFRASPASLIPVPLKKAELERFYQALVAPISSIYDILEPRIPIRAAKTTLRVERRSDKRLWPNL
jgi:hypothetical protein